VSERINGGLAKMAEEHVAIASKESTHYTDLLQRVSSIEKQRDDCRQEMAGLKDWIVNRLDESGQGRDNTR
jgi:hypothetical protein